MIISDDSIPETDIKYINQRYSVTAESQHGQPDHYINMELSLPRGRDGEPEFAVVKCRAIDGQGDLIGRPSKNPLTDTRVYEVQYLDGMIEAITENVIAENLLSQVDEEGHRKLMLDEIIDHRKNDDAINKDDAYFLSKDGIRRRKITTRGWDFCVQWKDGSSHWVALKDLKHSNPVELADYAIITRLMISRRWHGGSHTL